MAIRHHAGEEAKEGGFKGLFGLFGRNKRQAQAVTLLPRLICCMEQGLYVNLPVEMECLRNTPRECIFRHKKNGLRLCISMMQSELPIHKLTAEELWHALARRLIPSFRQEENALQMREYIRGFVKHSPTLQIGFTLKKGRQTEDHALYLLQWNHKLYAAAFSGITKENSGMISPICASISLKHHHEQT